MKVRISVLLLSVLITFAKGNIWPCETDDSCTAQSSYCEVDKGNCVCEFSKVFSTSFEKCLPTVLYGDACEDSNQCNLMPSGASCREGVCQCQDGFYYVRGKCRKLSLLNEDCNENTDCYFGYDRQSVVCKTNKCACANGYYERYNNICRQKSMALNDPCIVDTDCDIENGNGAKCENFKCILSANNNRRESREIAVQTSIDEIQLKTIAESPSDYSSPSLDENRTSASITSFTSKSNSLKHDDENGNKKYGDTCEHNGKPCPGLLHSSCVSNMCYCRLGYYPKNGRCMAELGEITEDPENCEFEYNTETKVCQCVRNYFYETNLRQCKKPIHFKLSCTSNSQCSPFGVAVCSPLIPRRCQCKDIAVLNESKQLCELNEGLQAPCETTAMCTVKNSYCSKEGTCQCIDKFVAKDGKCISGVGATCKDNSECMMDNTQCGNDSTKEELKTCQCKKGFVHFKDDCHKEVTEINEDCIVDDQCKPLLATCTDSKCQCKPNQHLSWNKCEEQKGIGEECSRAGECYMPEDPESVECRNSMCQCKIGYKSEQNVCKLRSKKNSSGRPSALKVITFILIGSAFVITTAALKQAYY